MTSIAGLRYITPLFELAREKDVVDDVMGGIKAFNALFDESVELRSVLLNPRIQKQKKKEIVLKITEEGFLPLLRDFFCLLVDKGRESVFPFLDQEFTRLFRESRNIVSATVESPVPLGDEYKESLASRFAEQTGKTVELIEERRPELIAGVRITVGSRMLDGSLKARLEGMRRHLRESSAAAAPEAPEEE
jgi:F-type H+-transporting ATPase subunit delta